MSEGSPSIFSYTDYRKFLADYYDHRKNAVHGYSHRQFSKKAGFKSPSVLKNAIEGTRNIGPDAIEQFILGLDLSGKKAEYFRCLVQFNQVNEDTDKDIWFARMQKCMPVARRRQLQDDELEYLRNWLYPVIRELSHNSNFRDDPYWIKRRLTSEVELKDIADALHFLKNRGFLIKNEEGNWEAADHAIVSSDELRSLAIRNYYRGVIRQSADVLDTIPIEDRKFQALILHTPAQHIPELKQKITDFMAELHRWNQSLPPGDGLVMQVLLTLYPQSKSVT